MHLYRCPFVGSFGKKLLGESHLESVLIDGKATAEAEKLRDQNMVFGPNTQDVWPPDYSVWPPECGAKESVICFFLFLCTKQRTLWIKIFLRYTFGCLIWINLENMLMKIWIILVWPLELHAKVSSHQVHRRWTRSSNHHSQWFGAPVVGDLWGQNFHVLIIFNPILLRISQDSWMCVYIYIWRRCRSKSTSDLIWAIYCTWILFEVEVMPLSKYQSQKCSMFVGLESWVLNSKWTCMNSSSLQKLYWFATMLEF